MNNAYKKFSMYLLLSLFLTLIGTYIGGFIDLSLIKVMMVLSLVLVLAFIFTKGKTKKIIYFIFCLGEGITLTPIVWYYTSTDILGCLLLVFLITVVFTIIGYKAKDLSFMGSILLISLLGLVFYEILRIFFTIPSLALLGVIIFCAYIAYDINSFKRHVQNGYIDEDSILNYVMDIYLDVLNLFVDLLEVFGDSN